MVDKMADGVDNIAAALDDINVGEIATGISTWGNSFMNKLVKNTKTVTESVITTLDPGMANFMVDGNSDKDVVNLVVCSMQQVKIEPVAEAWKRHWPYGSVNVKGLNVQPKTVPEQPVGAKAALQGCKERIDSAIIAIGKANKLKSTNSKVLDNSQLSDSVNKSGANKILKPPHCYLAVENYIDEVVPGHWFDISCLLLKDVRRNVEFISFSQAIPVDNDIIKELKLLEQEEDKNNVPKKQHLGFNTTVGKLLVKQGKSQSHRDWHEALSGVSRRSCIYNATRTLAHQYISLVYSDKE